MKYRCITCSGEYEEKDDRNITYYHACAPIIDQNLIFTERPNKRDENIGKIKAGLGRTKIS